MNRDKLRRSKQRRPKLNPKSTGKVLNMSSMLKRLTEKAKASAENGAGVEDPSFQRDYPCLSELMTTVVYEGKARKPTSLRVGLGKEGGWLFVLNDAETNQSAFYLAQTFADGLIEVEAALQEETLDWRRNAAWTVDKAKKKG